MDKCLICRKDVESTDVEDGYVICEQCVLQMEGDRG